MLKNHIPLWNEINLPAPHGDFCSYFIDDIAVKDDISNLISSLTDATSKIQSNQKMWCEVEIFLALQERAALKLSCNKFLQISKMVGHCLKNLVFLKLSSCCIDLAERFLNGLNNKEDVIANLPSQQQLEYLMIRIQGAAKLVLKTISYTEETFVYLIQQMKIGHFVQTLLMTCTTVGRIRFSYLAFLQQLCEIYQSIKIFHCKLKKGSWQWPSELDLPEDLWSWLKPEDFETNFSCQEQDKTFLKAFFHESTKNNSDNNNNEVIIINDSSENDASTIIDEPDVGEPQVRNSSTCDFGCETENKSNSNGTALHHAHVKKKRRNNSNSALNEKPEIILENISELVLFRQVMRNVKSVKQILIILKPLTSKKKIVTLQQTFQLTHSEAMKLKPLFYKIKAGFALTKCQKKVDAKKSRKKLLRKAKSKINVIFDKKIPVHTFVKLKMLYNEMIVNFGKNSKWLKSLTNIYETGRNNAKLLKENDERHLCKKLIYQTSKQLIKKYKESVL